MITLQKIPNACVKVTQYPNHAKEIVEAILASNPTKIIAVGGDGTINEIGNALKGQNIPLGIIPLGSGNGLARHLHIPMTISKAIEIALHGKPTYIDVLAWNKRAFFCTAGIGFDAQVAALFHQGKGRGFINYIIASIKALVNYNPIEIRLDDQAIDSYFSVTFANANQFGNNAYISPNSNLQDALFEIVKIRNGHLGQKVQLGISLFSKQILTHRLVTVNQVNSIRISVNPGTYYHVDGESFQSGNQEILIEILDEKLLVMKAR